MDKKSSAKRLKVFNSNWLEDEEFKPWLRVVEGDNTKFKCITCKKVLNLSSSGRGAVSDHAKGAGHKKAVEKIKSFFIPKPKASIQAKLKDVGDNSNLSADDTAIKAQIIWLLKSIASGYSNNSCDDIGDVLKSMDPDSRVLQNFKMKRSKASYVVNHGLAQYFKKLLENEINNSDTLVISFDESLNDVIQESEMVLIIRYWCPKDSKVKSRYYDSAFFGHGRAEDLLKQLNSLTKSIDKRKVISVSMDGPNVNLKMIKNLKEEWKEMLLHQLIDLGTCNLHVLSGAFKTGAEKVDWKILKTLKGSYQIFHDCPTRREDYTLVTGSNSFPQFFSATRWLENKEPADRLLLIWTNISKVWNWWLEKKNTCMTSKSMGYVEDAVKDKMTVPKLQFFSFLAGKLNPFLTKYQSVKPLIPFMYYDLKVLVTDLLSLIVKKSVMESEKTAKKLISIDLHLSENLLPNANIDCGFSVEHTLSTMIKSDQIGNKTAILFKKQCGDFVKIVLQKLFEKTPLKSSFLKYCSVFDPINLVHTERQLLLKSFKGLLLELVELSILSVGDGDECLSEFTRFIDQDVKLNSKRFMEFNGDERLDVFFYHTIGVSKYPKMSYVLRIILTLSHGNADVERNFSLKNNLEQNNQSKDTIVARRICKDFMCASNLKPFEVPITKEIISSFKSAKRKYNQHLQEVKEVQNKDETEEEVMRKKTKVELKEVIRSIDSNRIRIEEAEKAVEKSSEDLGNVCQLQRCPKTKLIAIQEVISKNLKRKQELNNDLEVLCSKKKKLEEILEKKHSLGSV